MFKNSSFLCLWGGQAASNFGDRLYMLAIITFIYKATDSALLTSMVPSIRLGMQLISSLMAPVVTQKLSLKNVLVLSQFFQSILFLALILVLINFQNSFIFIVIVISLLSFLHSWAFPLKNSILPELVPKGNLVRANSILSITDQAFSLFGWVGGGILISYLGPIFVLWFTFILFVLSTGLFFLIHSPSWDKFKPKKQLSWGMVLDGWKYVVQKPLYYRIFIVGIVQSFAGSIWVGSIILIFVKEILHKDESWLGFLNGAWLFGTIVGGIILSQWIQKRLALSLAWGLFLNGIMIIFFANCTDSLLSLCTAFLIGVPYQIHDVAKRTLLQMNTEIEKMTQIFATYQAVSSISFGIGIFVMNLLVDIQGVQTVYYVGSFLTLIASGLSLGVLRLIKAR